MIMQKKKSVRRWEKSSGGYEHQQPVLTLLRLVWLQKKSCHSCQKLSELFTKMYHGCERSIRDTGTIQITFYVSL